jgi:hypothetical protein
MSLSLLIIVRAFSGLSQALLIATCTAKERKGSKGNGARKEEKSIARAKRFVLVFFLSNPKFGSYLPPSQTLACWHPKLIKKTFCNKTAERKATPTTAFFCNSLDFSYLATKPKMGKHTLKNPSNCNNKKKIKPASVIRSVCAFGCV